MRNTNRFTSDAASFACPAGKAEGFLWDAGLPGFGMRAYSSGKRLWVVQYRDGVGRTRRVSLGNAAVVALDEARKAARRELSRVELGHDPQTERQVARQAVRVGALVADYLADAEKRLGRHSVRALTANLQRHAAPLHHDAAGKVGRADVVGLLAKVAAASGVPTANSVRASLSSLWTWALRTGRIEGANPVQNTPMPGKVTTRERVLTDAELALVWRACADNNHDRIVRLLILTGARREEIGGLAWDELSGGLWTLPGTRAKNGLAHELPLGAFAAAQLPEQEVDRELAFGLRKGRPFSGWSAGKARLDTRMGKLLAEAFEEKHGRKPGEGDASVTAWRLHDLRRTFSTWLNEHGVEPHIVEACLNHVSGAARRGVAGVYNRAQYREQKRAALARWEAHVRGLVELPAAGEAKVVALRGAA